MVLLGTDAMSERQAELQHPITKIFEGRGEIEILQVREEITLAGSKSLV